MSTKRKRGRPAKPPKDKAGEQVSVRLLPAEYAAWHRAAEEEAKPIVSLLRIAMQDYIHSQEHRRARLIAGAVKEMAAEFAAAERQPAPDAPLTPPAFREVFGSNDVLEMASVRTEFAHELTPPPAGTKE